MHLLISLYSPPTVYTVLPYIFGPLLFSEPSNPECCSKLTNPVLFWHPSHASRNCSLLISPRDVALRLFIACSTTPETQRPTFLDTFFIKFQTKNHFLWDPANGCSTCKLLSPTHPHDGPHHPQLGNLLGALSNWVELQNNAAPNDTVIYSTVGYHAITMPQDPKVLREDRLNSLACLLAVGIDPKRSILFLQDQVRIIS